MAVRDAAGPKGSTRRWRLAGRANSWVASLLVCAIVLMVNYLAFRHYERWDWTSRGLFTLSERTEKVLAGLSTPVELYVFLSRADPSYGEVEELLAHYRAKSDRLTVQYVDPDRSPSEYRTLLQRFGLESSVLQVEGNAASDVAAVLTAGERTWHIMRDDLLSMDLDSMHGGSAPKLDLQAERALTGGIVEVTEGAPTRVCATTGHGEWSLQEGGPRSLGALEQELGKDNVELETIETLGKSSIPERCDAVFVIGPAGTFTDEEAQLLGRYVRDGGSLLLALDPVFQRDRMRPTGLEAMAREQLGVRLDRAVALERDPARMLTPSPIEPFLVTAYGEHETTRPMRTMGGRTVVHLARSVTLLDEQRATGLLQTSDRAFGETNIAEVDPAAELVPDAQDFSGPLTLAVAVEGIGADEAKGADEGDAQEGEQADERRAGRAIVIGDSDWLRSSFLNAPQFDNFSLVSAWTGWLTRRQALISIPPRKQDVMSIMMTEGDITGVLFRVLVLMPAAVLLLGFAAWWSRRS